MIREISSTLTGTATEVLAPPMAAPTGLVLYAGGFLIVLAILFCWLAVIVTRGRKDMLGFYYLLAGISLVLAFIFQFVSLFLAAEIRNSIIFVNQVFLFLALVLFAITAFSLRRSKTPIEKEEEPMPPTKPQPPAAP
jgi:glucan phosphoethanolaminetransferase (alkaline phosphatase superfamily)